MLILWVKLPGFNRWTGVLVACSLLFNNFLAGGLKINLFPRRSKKVYFALAVNNILYADLTDGPGH